MPNWCFNTISVEGPKASIEMRKDFGIYNEEEESEE